MPAGERPPLPHLPGLDGLRALAVASVFAYPRTSGGPRGPAHPELFADDGTHMGPTGVAIFVKLILANL